MNVNVGFLQKRKEKKAVLFAVISPYCEFCSTNIFVFCQSFSLRCVLVGDKVMLQGVTDKFVS